MAEPLAPMVMSDQLDYLASKLFPGDFVESELCCLSEIELFECGKSLKIYEVSYAVRRLIVVRIYLPLSVYFGCFSELVY
jgi:hypothetical protein